MNTEIFINDFNLYSTTKIIYQPTRVLKVILSLWKKKSTVKSYKKLHHTFLTTNNLKYYCSPKFVYAIIMMFYNKNIQFDQFCQSKYANWNIIPLWKYNTNNLINFVNQIYKLTVLFLWKHRQSNIQVDKGFFYENNDKFPIQTGNQFITYFLWKRW